MDRSTVRSTGSKWTLAGSSSVSTGQPSPLKGASASRTSPSSNGSRSMGSNLRLKVVRAQLARRMNSGRPLKYTTRGSLLPAQLCPSPTTGCRLLLALRRRGPARSTTRYETQETHGTQALTTPGGVEPLNMNIWTSGKVKFACLDSSL